MTQQLHAYVVSLSWSSGMMSLIPVMSGGNNDGREHAAAMAAVFAMRSEPTPDGAIVGTLVFELKPEWLRAAVRMIETGSVEPAPVVRLVESDPPGPESPAA
jgi:hypothetical protein